MKHFVATLLLTCALLASGCNGQEPTDVFPAQGENNSDKSITLPKKDSDTNANETPETSTKNPNPAAEKNPAVDALDEESSNKTDDGSSSKPQDNSQNNEHKRFQGNSQNGEQNNPQGNEQGNSPSSSQDGEQNNPQSNIRENFPGSSQKNESEESFFDVLGENTVPILVGVIVLLVIVVCVLLYKLNNKKRPPKPSIVLPKPSEPPQPPKPSQPPPPIFVSDNNPASLGGTTSTLSKRPAFLVGTLWNIGKREEQQDNFCVSNNQDEQTLRQKGLMAVVADGMGGLEGGAKISKLVTNIFTQNYDRQAISSTANFLYNTAATAEKEVEKFIDREGITGGSTLVAIMIRNYELNFLSVGDSHIYLFQNGILTQLNREHNYGEILKEKAARNEVSPEEPYRNSQRHSLTAYIGMGSFNIVDKNSNPISLKSGDKVFLCSDGVYNALGDDALTALLKSDAVTAAKKIEAKILSQNLPKQDNFTGVIVELYEK